jgi:hypothetical protein
MTAVKKISGEEALNKLVYSIGYLNRKGRNKAIKRGTEIIGIFEELGEFNSDKVRRRAQRAQRMTISRLPLH